MYILSGAFGGVRAAMQLRVLCAEAGCSSVSRMFAIPKAQESLDENGVPTSDSMKETLEKNLKPTLDQLIWTATAFQEHKKKQPPPGFTMPQGAA